MAPTSIPVRSTDVQVLHGNDAQPGEDFGLPDPASLIAGGTIAAVVSDPRLPDNPIVACNDAFEVLTGYDRAEIIGRNCRFLHGEDTAPAVVDELRSAIRERRPVITEILNYRKDGRRFRNALMIAPVFDAAGELAWFIGSQVEVGSPAVQATADEASDAPAERARAQIALLTERQRQVLLGMARGALNKQIAWDIGLSERTVKLHRAAMLRVLGLKTSADAIRLAVEAGL